MAFSNLRSAVATLLLCLLPASMAVNYALTAESLGVPGQQLRALLSVFYANPKAVTISLTEKLTLAKLVSNSVEVSGNGSVNVLSFTIPLTAVSGGFYSLTVTNGIIDAAVDVEILAAAYTVLIQTDKPIYKPSQTVRIRTALIDGDLRPRNETVSVSVKAADGTVIQQWLNQTTMLGLAQFELPLSDRPPLGEWTITVVTKDMEQSKTIKIAEYVLPRFEVKVNVPAYALSRDANIIVNVSAIYTYGEPVSGNLKLQLFGPIPSTITRRIKIFGTTSLEIPMRELGILSDGFEIKAYAEVNEPLSNKTYNSTASIKVWDNNYLIKFMEVNSRYYRPGQNLTLYYEVSRPDGRRISGERLSLRVWILGGGDGVRSVVPENGIVQVVLQVPNNTYIFRLSSELIPENSIPIPGPSVRDLRQFNAMNKDVYLQAYAAIPGSVKAGDDVAVKVSSSSRSGTFFYAVIAKSRIVAYGNQTLNDGTVSIRVTQDFTPQASIVVYSVIEGELLADSVTFSVEGAIQNSVSLEFQNLQGEKISMARPGEKVCINALTEPSSAIGLLSVDQSILLLGGSSHDITQTQILTELADLVKKPKNSECDGSGDDEGDFRGFFFFPTFGGGSTKSIFLKSGLSITTDANLAKCPNVMPIVMEDLMVAAVRPGLMEKSESVVTPSQAPAPRQNFPETWLWSLTYSAKGGVTFNETVPDSMTSWITTAISMHPTKGLTVTNQPAQLTVKLPFFITAILPYSAIKGEEISVRFVMNNYGESNDRCTLTVNGSDQYEVKLGESESYTPSSPVEHVISLAKGAGDVIIIWLRPQAIGVVKLEASAKCESGASDSIIQELLVNPEGFPIENCETEFVQLTNSSEYGQRFSTEVPADAVKDSKQVTAIVTGDVMGPSIDGLDSLIQMPFGCGEQNMITFTPNIFVRRYLTSVNKLTPDVKKKTDEYMLTGYQRELTYRHPDGSFSAFGTSDPSGSTWLTAFVMKCFRQAQGYISVDSKVLSSAMDFLNSAKGKDGSFTEKGRVIHTDMQGGSSKGVTLSAYVVIAMLEDVEGPASLSIINSLRSTITYLENQYDQIKEDPYALAIVTYSLYLAKSSLSAKFLNQLESLQTTSDGLVHWQKEKVIYQSEGSMPEAMNVDSSAVEMTSYVLLTYTFKKDVVKARPVAKWLTKSRNGHGGFHSTQDTVLGLQALAAHAAIVVSSSTHLHTVFETDSGKTFSYNITADNAIITKRFPLTASDITDVVAVKIKGEGSAIISVCRSYNVLSIPSKPAVEVSAFTTASQSSSNVLLSACVVYTGEGDSGMGLTEVKLPTGYTYDRDGVAVSAGEMARIDYDAGVINVYWNMLSSSKSCVNIPLVEQMEVKDMKSSFIRGSQYYISESASRAFYNPQTPDKVVAPLLGAASVHYARCLDIFLMLIICALV